MKDPSRIYRWTVLGASILTIIYLLASAAHENYFTQWSGVQRQYREILRQKATDARGRELQSKFRIELKQVSLPALGTVDRCVTCHNGIDDPRMTDVALPHRVHPAGILDIHPVDRFGCTICHHGQGPATNFRDAKAEDAFWDYPLLPAELTQATCVTCHDAEKLPAAQIPLLAAGMKLYREKSCGSCHKLGGRGGALGPALDNEGAKTRHQLTMANLKAPHTTWGWQEAHFRDPGAVVTGSQMRNPTVTRQEALALTVYMLSQWKRDIPESYLAPDKIEQKYRALHPAPLSGEQVYRQYCFACHGSGTYSRWDKTFKRFIPAVRGISLVAAASPEYLAGNIRQGRPGTQMPAWDKHAGGLLPEEITAVTEYLRAGAPVPEKMPPLTLSGDAKRGVTLFLGNCAGCHGMNGRGGVAPEIGNPVFQKAASDELIVRTIRHGRQGTAMPAFQRPDAPAFSDQDVADVLAYVRTLGEHKRDKAVAQNAIPASGGNHER
ncbi:MAG TPA: c-type cytochrome [Terriglobales bacterium]|nr:c-type cytochrome [Terriglobales bacterium]